MADGQVLIDSKLDTGGVTKGANKIEKEFDQLAKLTKKTADIMERELKSLDVSDVAEGMADSFETEGEQVKEVLEEAADSAERSAERMSDAMRDSADEQSDAMRKAWDKTEAEADSGSRKVQDDIDDIGDKAKEAGKDIETNLGNAFAGLASKIGGIMATVFAVDELFEFGKEAVELGSDLAEVQNVVDVTFGAASSTIDEFAKTAIKQFGLSELSAKQFASTMGAMLKSMGDFDETQIVEMSTALAGLAGDMASFYNLDAQEAFDKLRAGISGETEPLKQLGINLSVANLEAYALANGIEKSYEKMTEQEKALLRYNYILSQTTDAQGDFARTQDSWANQTRILTEEFNSLKGTLGQGFINVLNPIVTGINGRIMPVLQNLADKFVELTETFDWNDLFGDVDFSPILGSLGNLGSKFMELAGIVGNNIKWVWDNVLVPFGEWTIDAGLPGLLNSLGAAFGAVASAIEWLAPLGEALWTKFLQPIASFTGDLLAATFQALAEAFTWVGESISNLFENILPSISEIGEKIKAIFPKIAETALDAFNRAGTYAQTGMIDPVSSGLDFLGEKGSSTAQKLATDMQSGISAAGAAAVETVQTTAESVDTIVAAEQDGVSRISQNAVTEATSAGTQIANSYSDAANNVTNTAFAPIEESGTATAEATAEAFEQSANTFKESWSDISTWFDSNVVTPIRTGIESISSSMSEKLAKMQSETATAWAAMVQTVEQSINRMQSAINSLTGKTVYINAEKTGSGASLISYSGYDGEAYSPEMVYAPATYNITPQTPYLATGAVIPPMAIASVSSRSSGMSEENIDAIAKKIAAAVEMSIGSIGITNNINFEGTLSQLGRLLKPVIDTEAKRRGKSLAEEVAE